ncbi:integrase [Vibrio jasicida]|uniref:integrase n=1 Tax=Vibrio jasicida TaxID=766224 RepID=UPI0005EE67D0|nr:integrase [Vibrio jasicida]
MMIKDKQRNKLHKQAKRFFASHYFGLGQMKTKETNLIHGRRTYVEQIRIISKAANDLNVKRLKSITPKMAQDYLNNCRNKGLSQKYLSNIKVALERLVFIQEPNKKLQRVEAIPKYETPLTDKDRAYTNDQINAVMEHLSPMAQLSTLLALNGGLRVEEILTLQRVNEAEASKARQWDNRRFTGRTLGERYIVTGKNGLRREVMIDSELAKTIESLRLETPKVIYDRGLSFEVRYDLLGGQKFSAAFSKASYQALGWSYGAHGLRFSYAQQRIDCELQDMPYSDAKLIVSQELGHFREEITERYIEPYG